MAVFAVVSSLQTHCLRAVACQLPDHETSLGQLPTEIKTKLVNLLSKRGLLTDSNLASVSIRRPQRGSGPMEVVICLFFR